LSNSIELSNSVEPHVGIGRSMKWWYALTRMSVIHCGSSLMAEMSLTTCSESPKSKRMVESSGSCHPAL